MKKLAVGVSCLLHPFVLPLYMLLLLLTRTAFAAWPSGVKLYLVWVVVLYALVIPALTLGLLRVLGRVSDLEIGDRRERTLPLLIGTVCYLLCAFTLSKIPSADFLRKFMLAAACCEAMCLVVSRYWKISLHLTGMGAAAALLTVMNIAGGGELVGLLAGVVLGAGALASSRLYLGYHDGGQVLAGFCGGFAVTAAGLLFL